MQMRLNGNVVLRSRDPSVLAKAWSRRADAEAAPSPGDGKVSLYRGDASQAAASQVDSAISLARLFLNELTNRFTLTTYFKID